MDGVASFSPGGRWLVFRSERDSNSEIYMMDVAIAAHPLQLAVLAALDVGAGLDVYLIGFPLDGARLELGVGNPRR